MSQMTKLRFGETIAARPTEVHARMLALEDYQRWTAAFCEGSTYQGSWEPGAAIRFVSPTGDGMVAEIVENRPGAFVSIRHRGVIERGVEDTSSEAVQSWAGALENYTFEPIPGGTRLTVELDTLSDYAEMMRETWPKALALLKLLCEEGQSPAAEAKDR